MTSSFRLLLRHRPRLRGRRRRARRRRAGRPQRRARWSSRSPHPRSPGTSGAAGRAARASRGARAEALHRVAPPGDPEARIRWRYRIVLNGAAVVLPRAAIPRLRALPGVRAVDASVLVRQLDDDSRDRVRQPQPPGRQACRTWATESRSASSTTESINATRTSPRPGTRCHSDSRRVRRPTRPRR